MNFKKKKIFIPILLIFFLAFFARVVYINANARVYSYDEKMKIDQFAKNGKFL